MVNDDKRAQLLSEGARKMQLIKGDFAEVGVYRGRSAAIICTAKGNKPLHLFDTFEGIPEVSKIDKGYSVGDFAACIENVKNYLNKYPKVKFYKGIFPDTATPVANEVFSLVHIDVDTYKSTLDCLKFFYPRISKGGMIVAHDYPQVAGVKKAFDEFFDDKQEEVKIIGGAQCQVIKI